MSTLKKIAIICGGQSSEHQISCVSARGVLAAIDRKKFQPILIGITEKEGRWILLDEGNPFSVGENGQHGEAGLPSILGSGPELIADIHGFKTSDGSSLEIDCAFPLLHGPYGEDGTIQGFFEMAHIPYVGSGVLASSVAMDKSFAKPIYASFGMSVAKGIVVRKKDWNLSSAQKAAITKEIFELGFPLFIKPARSGSSRGTSKVKSALELDNAINFAHNLDPKAIVEVAIAGREIECAVLEVNGVAHASVVGEIKVLGKHEFYDFEAKYLDGSTQFVIPAEIPAAVATKIQSAALTAFTSLGCEGLARVDFFLTSGNEIIINELNTMPGFTATSVFPMLWQVSGRGYTDVITTLIESALFRSTSIVR